MFCPKCGKEIANQAKFCNYCGNQISQPQTPPQYTPTADPAPAKKKGKSGRAILSIILVAAVFFGARFISASFVSGTQDKPSDSAFEQGFKEGLESDLDASSAMNSCIYGALYQDGYLTYGAARLYMPGYELVAGEGDETDYLISSDGNILFNAYRTLEVNLSYDASNADGMLQSYQSSSAWSNVSMMDFSKKTVNGLPVISYIVKATADGMDMYVGELIIFPEKTPSQTVRLGLQCLAEIGPASIQQIFDSLEISYDYTLSSADTGVVGLNRITVK